MKLVEQRITLSKPALFCMLIRLSIFENVKTKIVLS